MAVPFILPEDQNEVEIIIFQLQDLLMKLQAAVRRSRGANLTSSQVLTTRVRSVLCNRMRTRDEDTPSTSSTPSTNLPDLLTNLGWLAAASQDASNSPQLTASSVIRSPRRRTCSESSCCEETKISITAVVNHGIVQDWNQGEASSEQENASGEAIFSKLVPSRVSAPWWTAMICFVGWHLYRAR